MALAQSYDTNLGDPTYNPQCDFNGDRNVDLPDLMVLAVNYDKGPAN